MPFHFANVAAFALCSVAFVLVTLKIASWVRPRFPSPEKEQIYECGEKPIGVAWFNFNPRFYVVALVFVVFEVEIALMLPVVLVYKALAKDGAGGLAFSEILAFIVILAVGLAWVWVRGDLDWIKKLSENVEEETPRR